jgi:sugar phosphate isomerase/epimerase
MNRREFLMKGSLGAAALAVGPAMASAFDLDKGPGGRGGRGGKGGAELKISFQENNAPGETLAQRWAWMEAHGVTGFEPWGGGLGKRIDELKGLMARHSTIKISAICAGFDGFILAEDPAVKAQFDSTMREIVVAAGELGSVGVIMVPAFNRQKPCKPHTLETRDFLVEELAKLGEFALQHGTTVILEPLNRREAFYLRQVGDAAAIARDTRCDGVRCMGDFWHMSEETSDYGALWSGGKYMNHVHIASRANRIMPGEDGDADNYIDGFRALKEMKYNGYVSLECGTRGDKNVTAAAAIDLMKAQWKIA